MKRESEADPTAATMNLKQVAASLGVHYMTAYRYVRQGRLEAERDGTEWRVRVGALEAFRSGRAAPAEPGADVAWDERLAPCLAAGDEVAAWTVLEAALAAGRGPRYCYLDVLERAFAIVEAATPSERADGTVESAATVAVRLVARLGGRFRRPGRSRGTVVVGAAPGERRLVRVVLVADLLRLDGFDALELGLDATAAAFLGALRRTPRPVGAVIADPAGRGAPILDTLASARPELSLVALGAAPAGGRFHVASVEEAVARLSAETPPR